MDYQRIAYLRAHSAAWRLLRADTAPLVLAVLGRIFVVDNVRAIAEDDLVTRVDDALHAVNTEQNGGSGSLAYPRSARDYVGSWADPEQGWLRKFYPEGTTAAHYDATSDLEKAYGWVAGLEARAFVGTESRLHTLVDLLRQIVLGADADPASRIASLHARRAELDAEIVRAETGQSPPLDTAALLDRYQHFASTARELLADFREVEENFRALDRGAREKIAAWDGAKGELLDQLVGDRHAIAASDQGRSFQAFHDFLLSRRRQDELGDLLERLIQIDEIDVDHRLRHAHHDWLDAAERTQQTVRLLSEQLRRFLDDKVWLENRRVMDLLRSVERSALAIRHLPRPDLQMSLDALAPRVRLPLERPLYAPAGTERLDSAPVTQDDADIDTADLFDEVHVDIARLVAVVRTALRGRDQVCLDEILRDHPPILGVAEIVGYLTIAEDDLDIVTDESRHMEVPYIDASGAERRVRMPVVTMLRRHALVGGRL